MLVKDQNNLKICISLGILAIFTLFLGNWEAFVENYYSPKIYPLLSEWLRTLSGIFPFNIGDWLYKIKGQEEFEVADNEWFTKHYALVE